MSGNVGSALPGWILAAPFSAVRSACAAAARRARFVRIDEGALVRYAAELPAAEVRASVGPRLPSSSDPELLSAFVLLLDAVNFGSGYFPHLAKREGCSGYRTVEACLLDWFARHGPPDPAELAAIDAERCAEIFEQTLAPPIDELMDLYARAWRDLARTVPSGYAQFVAECRGSGAELVRRLLEMPLFRDVARHQGEDVPLLKRAQLAVADLHGALGNALGGFSDLDQLTLFADNLVPHVLRLDGVIQFAPELVARIQREELLPPGSAEEVEIRAVAVHAVELLAARSGLRPRELDYWLWERGGAGHYKAQPRHRTRCPYY